MAAVATLSRSQQSIPGTPGPLSVIRGCCAARRDGAASILCGRWWRIFLCDLVERTRRPEYDHLLVDDESYDGNRRAGPSLHENLSVVGCGKSAPDEILELWPEVGDGMMG
jgi:hypothetical protein